MNAGYSSWQCRTLRAVMRLTAQRSAAVTGAPLRRTDGVVGGIVIFAVAEVGALAGGPPRRVAWQGGGRVAAGRGAVSAPLLDVRLNVPLELPLLERFDRYLCTGGSGEGRRLLPTASLDRCTGRGASSISRAPLT